MNNKGVDQSAQIGRLVWAFVVRKHRRRFSPVEAHIAHYYIQHDKGKSTQQGKS